MALQPWHIFSRIFPPSRVLFVFRTHHSNLTANSSRRGAAIVELAICLPFVFLLVVGAIELSSGLHHQMAIRNVAHQCAIRGADGAATCNDIQALAQSIMPQLNVTNYSITIDEVPRSVNIQSVESASVTHFDIPASGPTTAGFDEVPRGTVLRLVIQGTRPAPDGLNLISNYLDDQITAQCVFVKEK